MKRFQASPSPQLHPYIDRLWGWESEADDLKLARTKTHFYNTSQHR
ncbi:MAG: hypothetical protein HY254_17675 [Burkholderiales bacterium]|nr:hypothetical protein [Burkholderiales bacterium]